MINYKEWKQIKEAVIDKAPWGYEISGSVAEVIRILQKAPPNKDCIASVTFQKKSSNKFFSNYKEWKQMKEVVIDKQPWGYEISGTVAEVIGILQKVPPDKDCIATVTFKREVPNKFFS